MGDERLGLWKDDDLLVTVSSYTGTQYYHYLPDEVQFVHSVSKILAMRNARDKPVLCSAPSLYVLAPVPENVTIAPKREPTFSLGGVNVAGKVWFGAPAMNSCNGFSIPPYTDTDALFLFVSKTLASGSRPAIYFDGSANEAVLRFYPKGVDLPDDCEDILFGGTHLSETTLKRVLDRIHERFLITPTASMASGELWVNGEKSYPVIRAESAVQKVVEIGLGCALGNVRVKRERTGVYGRFDLALIEQDPQNPSKATNHAILELKVVKAFTSTGKAFPDGANKIAVLKGVKQAFAYREEHGSRISALCCYDMRPDPSLQKYSGRKCKIAEDLGVKFWAWNLFSTTESARNRLARNRLKGA